MLARDMLGKEILDANARSIGKVADIDFDIGKGTMNHLVVKAGLKKGHNISFDKIDKIGDKVILTIRQDDLQKKS